MKTANNKYDKEKFFAQYWQQLVLFSTEDGVLFPVNGITLIDIEKDYLLLKSLSGITDEDAIEVARIILPSLFMTSGNNNKHKIDRSNDGWISITHKFKEESVDIDLDGYVFPLSQLYDIGYIRNHNMVNGIDYLRSKGYALPYMGLSIDDLIDYGWIKIKTDERL